MTIEPQPAGQPSPPQEKPSADRPPRKRRWILKSLLALVVCLAVLVVLAPRIASTSPVRRLVLNAINRNVAGRVDIADWSLTWTGGITISDIALRQPDGEPFVRISRVRSRLSLLKALSGRFDFGSTTIEGLDARLRVFPDGSDSFTRFLSVSPPPGGVASPPSGAPYRPGPPTVTGPSSPPPSAPAAAPAAPRPRPAFSGVFYVTGKAVVQADGAAPVEFPAIKGGADISIPAGTFAGAIDLLVRCADGRPGRIALAGNLKAQGAGDTRLSALEGRQSLELVDVDLSSLRPFLTAFPQITRLAGTASGNLALTFAAGKEALFSGSVRATDVSLAGTMFAGGETFSCRTLSLDIPSVRIVPAGDDILRARLTVGAESADRVALKADQGTASLFADVTIGALLRAIGNQPPGDAGRMGFDAVIDVGALAAAMPRTFGILPEVKVVGGTYRHSLRAVFTSDRADYSAEVALTGLSADVPEKGRIAVKDMTFSASASNPGGKGLLPELRDLKVALNSAFATADVQSPRLDSIHAVVEGDLAQFRREIGQIIDLGQTDLAGQFKLSIRSAGDMSSAGGTAKFDLKLTGTGIALKTAALEIDEPRLVVQADGLMRRGRQSFVQSIEGVSLSAVSGSAAAPTAMLSARAALEMPDAQGSAGTAPPPLWEMHIDRLEIDVARTLKQFGMLRRDTARQHIVQSGTVVSAKGTLKARPDAAGGGIHAAIQVAVPHLKLLADRKPASWDNAALVQFTGAIGPTDVQIAELAVQVENGASLKFLASGRALRTGDRLTFENIRGSLSYDAEKLLAMLRPLMGETAADLRLKGSVTDQPVRLAGYWQTGAPLTAAVRNIDAAVALSFDEVQAMGLKMTAVAPEIALSRGVLAIDSRKPISCSNGSLHINGIRVDLTADSPRLTIPRGPLVNNVAINPILADLFLGQFSFLFRGITEASGALNITVERFDGIPVAWLMPAPADAPRKAVRAPGSASVTMSLDQGMLVSGLLTDILKAVGVGFRVPGAAIVDGRINVADGRISSTIPLLLDRHKLTFSSTIDSATGNIIEGDIAVPGTLAKLDADLHIAVTGHYSAPRPDIARTLAKTATSAAASKILQSLGGSSGKERGQQDVLPKLPVPVPSPSTGSGDKDKPPAKKPLIPGLPDVLPSPEKRTDPGKDTTGGRTDEPAPAVKRPTTRPSRTPPTTAPSPRVRLPSALSGQQEGK